MNGMVVGPLMRKMGAAARRSWSQEVLTLMIMFLLKFIPPLQTIGAWVRSSIVIAKFASGLISIRDHLPDPKLMFAKHSLEGPKQDFAD